MRCDVLNQFSPCLTSNAICIIQFCKHFINFNIIEVNINNFTLLNDENVKQKSRIWESNQEPRSNH